MMNRPVNMYRKGGLKDEGGEIDPVSGNEVPVGGTKKGVRDDIPANLSEGEFVMPEDATRYHGLKTMMKMRQEAKMGLKQMEAMGLMGNADEAILPDDLPFGLDDLIIVEVDDIEETANMNVGGMASGQAGETVSLTGNQQIVPTRPKYNVSFDNVMSEAKMEFKEYRNAEGQSLMVPFIGGTALYPIPEGYTLYTGESDGEVPAVPDVPSTGADALTQQDDGKDEDALTAYRQSGKSTKVNWEDMSTEEFLQKANERNGFGRNLALGVASMINPLASIGMSALMRMEDEKVLTMARARMEALPAGSAQRAEYEKMIAAYEDRGKGLFGGIIGKIATKIGDLLGMDDKQKQRGQNANMVSHTRNIGDFSVNGQATEAAVQAVETGKVKTPAGEIALQQFVQAQNVLQSKEATPEQKQQAATFMSNHIGGELGSFVNPTIMSAVQQGTVNRNDLVRLAYQPASDLKSELDSLSDNQKAFLGYDGSNYRDVIDIAREEVSQILPTDVPRMEPQIRPVVDGTTQRMGEFGLTEASRAASAQRREDGTAMGMLDTTGSTVPAAQRDFTQLPTSSSTQAAPKTGVPTVADPRANVNALEGPEATRPVPLPTVAEPDPAQRFTQEQMKSDQDKVREALGSAFEEGYSSGKYDVSGIQDDVNSVADDIKRFFTNDSSLNPTASQIGASSETVGAAPTMENVLSSGGSGSLASGFGSAAASMAYKPDESTMPDAFKDIMKGSPIQAPVNPYTVGGGFDVTAPAAVNNTVTTVTPSQQVQDAVKASDIQYDAFGNKLPTVADVVPDVAPKTTTTGTATSFDDAFAAARAEEKKRGLAAGTSKFTYNGKEYSTALATDATSTGTSAKKEETKGKYDPTANKQLSAGFTTNTLSQAEQDAFDAAVDSGDSSVANHYASINRLRNKQDAYADSNFDPAVGASLGLSANDMEQAEKYGGSVQTAINEGRAESQGILQPAKVTDSSKSKNDTSPAVSKPSTNKDNNVASSGRSESEIQADINAAIKEAGEGNWTSELNDLVAERDSARANEGSSTPAPSNNNDGGGSDNDGGGSSNDKIVCTEMYRQTQLVDWQQAMKVWDVYHKKHLTPYHQTGYHWLFQPYVKGMRKSTVLTKLGATLAKHRTQHLRHVLTKGKSKDDIIGNIWCKIVHPVVYVAGIVKEKIGK